MGSEMCIRDSLMIAFNSEHPRLVRPKKDFKTIFRDQDSQSGSKPVTHQKTQDVTRAEALENINPIREKVRSPRSNIDICFWGKGCKDKNCPKVHPAAPPWKNDKEA